MSNANKDVVNAVIQLTRAAWEGYKAYQQIDKINKNQKRLR